jgi:Cupin-like domain
MEITRRQDLAVADFVENYLRARQPVIVTDAMKTWRALSEWTPASLQRNYGERLVPIYGNYFDFKGVVRLAEFISTYMGPNVSTKPAYARWFTRHQAVADSVAKTFPWADDVFKCLRSQWGHPYFLPDSSYLLPFCSTEQSLDISSDVTVPSKALYLSGAGAVTSLHIDYWGSDAVLCQFHGRKKMTLYGPDQASFLVRSAPDKVRGTTGGNHFVDIKAPDLETFPLFHRAKPAFSDNLNPGEIVYIPAGWLHHVDTISDSITVTWNFVHAASWRTWFKFLMGSPPANELHDIEYLLFEDAKRLI